MPPEVIWLLPVVGHLDKVMVQKAATPVLIPQSVEEARDILNTQRVNCVVDEKSQDAADANAQYVSALQNTMDKINTKVRDDLHAEPCGTDNEYEMLEPTSHLPMDVKSKPYVASVGNTVLERLAPWYFGVVLSFYVSLLYRYTRHGNILQERSFPSQNITPASNCLRG